MTASSLEPLGAYFKANGWPEATPGKLKTIAQMDRGELCALARQYTAALQTEFAQINAPAYRAALNKPERLCPISGLPERIFSGPQADDDDEPVRLMQSHSPAHLAGIHPPLPKPPLVLTKAMLRQMTFMAEGKPWDFGCGRAGGAVSRMWDRLEKAGYATPIPHRLTTLGLKAVRLHAEKHKRITPAVIQRIGRVKNERTKRSARGRTR